MDAKIFRINYKSDFILTLTSDAGWMTPFCIKFWTGAPSQAFFAQWDGTTYTHCAYDPSEPTKLTVQFDDHHLPIGELKYQVAYHFTVDDFPNDTEDEVLNQAGVTTEIDGEEYQVMLDFTGETAPEIQFSLPAYANEAQRIANEQQRIANEQTRIANEEQRIAAEQTRQQNEATRIAQEEARVTEFARLKRESEAATGAANDAAALANQKAQLAADKAALAQQKAEYAQTQGNYAKEQGDYAKAQGDYAKAQGDTAQADHERAAQDHERAESDHAALENVPDSVPSTSPTDLSGNVEDVYLKNRSNNNPQAPRTLARLVTDSAKNRPLSESLTRLAEYQSLGFPAFSTSVDYAEGDPCFHDRRLYKAKAGGHSAGTWNAAHFEEFSLKEYTDAHVGIFDVSANNDGAVFASLQALLGDANLNTLIPAPFRRGGITITFIQGENAQSSDNKYVEYFLPKNEWSIDPNDWEKINLEQDLRFLSNDFQCFRMFGSSKADGVMQGTLKFSDFFRSILSLQLIGFEKGIYYVQTVQRKKGVKYRLIFYKYDSDTQTWSNYADFRYDGNIEGPNYDEIGVFDKTLENGKRCIAVVDFSFYKNTNLACGTTTSFVVKDECLFPNGLPLVPSDISEMQQDITNLENEVAGCVNDTDISIDIVSNNIANPSNIQDGMIVNSEGGFSPLNGWSLISVPVSEGDVLTVGGFTLGRFAYYAYYNGSSLVSFGQIQDPQGTSNPTTFTIPSGVDTLYIDIKTDESGSNYDNLMINYGNTLKEYDEFKQAITAINNVPLAGQAIGESLNNLVVDLPVSDGTDIQSGYAYIDSVDRCVKIKA